MTSEYRPTGRATEIAFDVLGLPPGLNGTHGHWRTAAGERKKWRELGAWHAKKAWLKAGGGPPWSPVWIVVTRLSERPMDFDNRVAAAKPLVDSLVDAGIIPDDTDDVIVDRAYRWERAPRGQGRTRIEIHLTYTPGRPRMPPNERST